MTTFYKLSLIIFDDKPVQLNFSFRRICEHLLMVHYPDSKFQLCTFVPIEINKSIVIQTSRVILDSLIEAIGTAVIIKFRSPGNSRINITRRKYTRRQFPWLTDKIGRCRSGRSKNVAPTGIEKSRHFSPGNIERVDTTINT